MERGRVMREMGRRKKKGGKLCDVATRQEWEGEKGRVMREKEEKEEGGREALCCSNQTS